MFASVGRANASSQETVDIPEWKRLLIMKKRGLSDEKSVEKPREQVSPSECCRRCAAKPAGLTGTCENLAPGSKPSTVRVQKDNNNEHCAEASETVIRTIGNITVELRSVYPRPSSGSAENNGEEPDDRVITSPLSDPVFAESNEIDDHADLQYGPGIVDRLRARFLNLGVKKCRKPVVRKFSSLENLSAGSATMFRSNGPQPCGERRSGGTRTTNGTHRNQCEPNFKKAQSMETLLISDKTMLASRSRHHHQFMMPSSNNSTPSCRFSAGKRSEFVRQLSVPGIKEDELPKPDTVKHFKKIFESPPTSDSTCQPTINNVERTKPRAQPALPGIPASAIPGNYIGEKRPSFIGRLASKFDDDNHHLNTAKPSAKVTDVVFSRSAITYNLPLEEEPEDKLSPDPPSVDSEKEIIISSPLSLKELLSPVHNTPASNYEPLKCNEVIEERLPCLKSPENSVISTSEDDESSQGSQVANEPERVANGCVTAEEKKEEEVEYQPHPSSDDDENSDLSSPDGDNMVVAINHETEHRTSDVPQKQAVRKTSNWQKPPPTTTSVVFDFRGKDVKPSIPLKPTPFGCKPAKVKKKKRSGSPPRSDGKVNGVTEPEESSSSEEDEDWDELDVGAHLPAASGIVFVGENVKVGKGALLVKRNKNLTIQFDDATSTFEYPTEVNGEENGHLSMDGNLRSSSAKDSLQNSGLSSYTPHVLSTESFELGISRPPSLHINNSSILPTSKCENAQLSDVVIPADPDDSSGWSSAETVDILF